MNTKIDFYLKQFHLENCTFSKIEHDDAMVATVYKIVTSDRQALILKICTRIKDYLHEDYFLKFFGSTLPVPHIVEQIEPKNEMGGAVLMECIPGNLMKATDFSCALLYQLGSLLARIHSNRRATYDDLGSLQNLQIDPRVYFSLKFSENIAECKMNLPAIFIDQCQKFYETHLDSLLAVDGPCIVHRDFCPGNLFIHDGKVSGIIDWAGSGSGFAEEDFCAIEHDEWSMSKAHKKSFFEGYASIRSLPDYRTIMPILRINKALGIMGFTIKCGTWNNRHSALYESNKKYIEKFFGNG